MGDVIQFLYGEDGMDGAAIESQTMEHLRWDRKKLEVCSLSLPSLCQPQDVCCLSSASLYRPGSCNLINAGLHDLMLPLLCPCVVHMLRLSNPA